MKKAFLDKCYALALWGVVLSFFYASNAYAGATEIDDVARNVVTSAELLPGLLTGLAYILALLFGVTGVLKLKEHVDNPNQTPLRTPVIRFLVGGGLLALPIVYDAMRRTFFPGALPLFDPSGVMGGAASALIGNTIAVAAMDFNQVLKSIRDSFQDTPGIVAAATYLMGLLLGFTGMLKIKEHVENPDQTPMREPIVRLLTGGALFSIPAVYEAVYNTFGAGGLSVGFTSILTMIGGMLYAPYANWASTICNPVGLKMGNALCGVVIHTGAFPAFLTAVGYVIGLIMAVWGVFKIKAHVNNPQQTPLHEGVSRLLAAGAFFSVPGLAMIARNTLGSNLLLGMSFVPNATKFNETPTACNTGLDGAFYCFMEDIFGPGQVVLNFFSICAGIILVLVGISRLIKTAQEGPRGPGGFGTLMTFLIGGALLSYNELMRAATSTFFTNPMTATRGTLAYTAGMTAAEVQHAHTVISAVIKFMILVGLISFVRGLFIIREVAEGNQQASLMAGVTHMVGGALAVNLGPLINVVQATLGIGGFGINFI